MTTSYTRDRSASRHRHRRRHHHRRVGLRAGVRDHRARAVAVGRHAGLDDRRAADHGRRAGLRRAVVGLSAHRRRLRLPPRDLLARARVPVGLGDVLEHAHGHRGGHRHRVRPLCRRTSCRWATSALRGVAVGAILVLSAVNYVGVRFGSGVQTAFTVVKVVAVAAIIARRCDPRSRRRWRRRPASTRRRPYGVGDFLLAVGAGPLRLRRLAHGDLHRGGNKGSGTDDSHARWSSGRSSSPPATSA